MKRTMIGVGVVVMAVLLYATTVSAAVTGCINAYTYNDTGNATNVTAGNVCINATDYDVDPTAVVFCSDSWAGYVDGACNYTSYYVGYAGDGTATCVATDWQVNVASVFIAQDYIINTTTDALISGDYVTNTGETATYDTCLNDYTRQGPTGYCDGAGALDTDGATTYVSVGNVCYVGTDANPNATTYCGIWSDCVAEATTADEYYVGYAAGGTGVCVASGWVATGTTFTTETGQTILTTESVDTCSVYGYAYTYVKSDLKVIIEDGLGTAGAEAVSWFDILVLLLVLVFAAGLVMKWKGMY